MRQTAKSLKKNTKLNGIEKNTDTGKWRKNKKKKNTKHEFIHSAMK